MHVTDEKMRVRKAWFKAMQNPSPQTAKDILIRDLTPTHILKAHDEFVAMMRDISK